MRAPRSRPLGQARQSRHMSRRQRSSWSASRALPVHHAEHCGEEQCIFNLSCSCLRNCRRRRSLRHAAAPSTPYTASTARCSEKFNTKKVNLSKPRVAKHSPLKLAPVVKELAHLPQFRWCVITDGLPFVSTAGDSCSVSFLQ